MLLTSIWILAGCQAEKKPTSQDDMFFNKLNHYEATATVTFFKDAQVNQLCMKQIASKDGSYEMLYLSPEHLEGTKVIYDGNQIKEYYKGCEEPILQKPGVAENEILLTTVVARLLNNQEVKKQETLLNGRKMMTYEMPIEGQYKYLAKEKLWVDKEKGTPLQLQIYDIAGNISIEVTYEAFKYNR